MAIISPNAFGVFTGRKLRNVVLTPITLNTTAPAITRGSAFDLVTAQSVESVVFEQELMTEEISAASSLYENYVGKKYTWTATVEEIEYANGESVCTYIYNNFVYVLIEATVDLAADGVNNGVVQTVPPTVPAAGFVIQAPGIITASRQGMSEGKEVANLIVRPCGLPLASISVGGAAYY